MLFLQEKSNPTWPYVNKWLPPKLKSRFCPFAINHLQYNWQWVCHVAVKEFRPNLCRTVEWTACLKLWQSILIWFKSTFWLGHSKTIVFFSWNHSVVDLLLCLALFGIVLQDFSGREQSSGLDFYPGPKAAPARHTTNTMFDSCYGGLFMKWNHRLQTAFCIYFKYLLLHSLGKK